MMRLDGLYVLQQQVGQGLRAGRVLIVYAALMTEVDDVLSRDHMLRFVVVVDIGQADVVAAQVEPSPLVSRAAQAQATKPLNAGSSHH